MRALNNALQCYCQPLSTGDFRPVEAGFILYFIIFYNILLLFIFIIIYILFILFIIYTHPHQPFTVQ